MIFPLSEITSQCKDILFISDHCWSVSGGNLLGVQAEEELKSPMEREKVFPLLIKCWQKAMYFLAGQDLSM